MNESKIVRRLLFPANQEPARSVGPRVRCLDHPASSFLPGSAAALFFATTSDVRNVPEAFRRGGRRLAKVPFVETQMLLQVLSTFSSNGYRSKRVSQKPLIVSVGAGNRDAQRNAAGIGQDRSLDTELTAVGGIFPGFFPRPAATWWSRHRELASATRCLVSDRISAAPVSKTAAKYPGVSTLGSSDVRYWGCQIVAGVLSTGSRSATDKESRWRQHADSRGVAQPLSVVDISAARAQAAAKVFRASKQTCPANRSAYTPPCKQRPDLKRSHSSNPSTHGQKASSRILG